MRDVGKCTVGQDMKPGSQLASHFLFLFFHSFFFLGRGKGSPYVETYQKVRKGTLRE